jgi:hypothetical protein
VGGCSSGAGYLSGGEPFGAADEAEVLAGAITLVVARLGVPGRINKKGRSSLSHRYIRYAGNMRKSVGLAGSEPGGDKRTWLIFAFAVLLLQPQAPPLLLPQPPEPPSLSAAAGDFFSGCHGRSSSNGGVGDG